MRKRISASLVAAMAAVAMSGTPAQADTYHTADDFKQPIPCNPYPPGKKFTVTAIPSQATIKKGSNVNVVAVVTRGVGSDKKHCKYHLTILRYKSRPGSKIKTHRTGERGTAAYTADKINGTLFYYFDLLYNNTYYSSNVGRINVN